MSAVLHHFALVLAILLLGQAALRIASVAAPQGLERVIAALVTGVALAVIEAMVLGLVDLGGDTVALVAAAACTWAAARLTLPHQDVSAVDELIAWWRRLPSGQRLAAAAAAGLCAGWLVWQLRNFSIGFDSALYHYPLVASWIQDGTPGAEVALSYDIPYGNYPLTDEVLLTWGTGIARSWIPIILWNALMFLVLAGATWHILRNLSISRAPAGLATAVLVTSPIVVRQLNEPQNDLPALGWLACVAALATSAGRHPPLLVPAVVAAGLAVGTKPSTGPMVVAALCVGIYLARGRLRPIAPWLALGVLGAILVGGFWYLRNFIQHGSPLWPFIASPWGDPEPAFLSMVDVSFLDRPGATLEGRLGKYAERLAGAWLVVAGTVVALVVGAKPPRSARHLRGPLLLSGGLAVIGLLLWSTAWSTGISANPGVTLAEGFALSGVRFMLPAIGAATIALALVTRIPGPIGYLGSALFAGGLVWSLTADARLGPPWTAPATALLVGAVGGVAVLGLSVVAKPVTMRIGRAARAAPSWSVGAVATASLGVLLATLSDGVIERQARVSRSTAYGGELVSWFVDQPGFNDKDGTIGIASLAVIAQLGGDHFNNRVVLVPPGASCSALEALARRMPVVVTPVGFGRGFVGVSGYTAPACFADHKPIFESDPYYVYRLPN